MVKSFLLINIQNIYKSVLQITDDLANEHGKLNKYSRLNKCSSNIDKLGARKTILNVNISISHCIFPLLHFSYFPFMTTAFEKKKTIQLHQASIIISLRRVLDRKKIILTIHHYFAIFTIQFISIIIYVRND